MRSQAGANTNVRVVAPTTTSALDLAHIIDRRIVRKVRPFARTLVRVINSIPQNIYTGAMDLTNAVAGKLEDFGDALSGKGQTNADGEHDFVQVKKPHFDYMERLRKEDHDKYQVLAGLATAYKAAPADKKDVLLLTFFVPPQQQAVYVTVTP